MKIGIDCRQIYDVARNEGAGIERYVFNLVEAMLAADQTNEYFLFFHDSVSPGTIEQLQKKRAFYAIKLKYRLPFVGAHIFFTFKLWSYFLDYCLFPANVMPFFYLGKSLLVVHDVIIYNHPEWFPNRQWFSKIMLFPASVAKATKIITVSETTRADLLDLFRFKRLKDVAAVYPGAPAERDYGDLARQEVREKFALPEKYLLYVGTIEPRKNLIRIFLAFRKYFLENDSTARLIVAGAGGWKNRKIFHRLEKINKQLGVSAIQYIGKVTDRERNILMQNAEVFLFPSLYEGFGLPVVEAMINRAPVITSKIGATGEFIADEALKVDPREVVDIYFAIKKILTDIELRQKLINRGVELGRRFSWDKTADAILEMIKGQQK